MENLSKGLQGKILLKEKELTRRSSSNIHRVKTKPLKRHILVVEDCLVYSSLIAYTLEDNYCVSITDNGQLAWDLLSKDHSIDIVISDIMMPKMDGYSLIKKIRSHQQLRSIPIILLTNLDSKEAVLNALRSGANDFLTKSKDIKELKDKVNHLINQSQYQNHQRNEFGDFNTIRSSLNARYTVEKKKIEQISHEETFMKKLEELIMEKLDHHDFKITDLAFKMNISERTLRNKVRAITGLSPSRYLRSIRLEQAKKYVEARKYGTIREISYSVGLKDAKNFARLYRNTFGPNSLDCLRKG